MTYNEKTIYYIWIQQVLGYGSPKVSTILNMYSDIKKFYHISIEEKAMIGCFTQKEIQKLKDISLDKANVILENCEKLSYKIITYHNDKYPKCLKEIFNPPALLYVKGDLPNVDNNLSIGIVGARKASSKSMDISFNLGKNLAKSGVIIVSGGAVGIDSFAHLGALHESGTNICVLGCGLNYNYLKENEKMRNDISKNGAIISEYPPNMPPYSSNFPMRNRIISGLSKGVVVVEAGTKSGSLITARLALEQNRDVFAVPGDIDDKNKEGTNNLIKQGAKITTSVFDILEEYEHTYSLYIDTNQYENIVIKDTQKNSNTKKEDKEINNIEPKKEYIEINNIETKKVEIPSYITDDEKKVYDILTTTPMYAEEIMSKTDFTITKVLTTLTNLELYGLIKLHSGRRFSK